MNKQELELKINQLKSKELLNEKEILELQDLNQELDEIKANEKIISIENPVNVKEKSKRGRKPKINLDEIKKEASEIQNQKTVQFEDLTPVCIEAIKLPFELVNGILKTKSFSLDESEANILGVQLNGILKIYMPQMTEKNAIIATFSLSLGLIALKKYSCYSNSKNEDNKQI
jgi:hypothetical protein